MTLCLLSSLAILCSLVVTLTEEVLKLFASVWSGEYEALNATNPVNKIVIYYRDIPMLDPCDSITLIMDEFEGKTRLRVSYLLLTKKLDGFYIKPRNFTEQWISHHTSQDRLNFVKPSDVTEENPLCTRKFHKAECPPYIGSYPGCTVDDQNPTVMASVVDCSGVSITDPNRKVAYAYKKVKKGVPNREYLSPRMDPCH